MYNGTMKRTTLMAEEALLERLRAQARERGLSFAQVVREALEEKARQYRPKPKSPGSGSSGRGDIARTEGTEPVPPHP
jgi:hypothetical protein